MWLYNFCMVVYATLIRLASPFYPKARLWCEGRRGMLDKMQRVIAKDDKIVWIHVASLGDFEQGRPLVDYIKRHYPSYKILLTFFSPSGYEVRKNYPNADYVFYIPADTKRDVSRFLDIVKPDVAIFVKYEFWLNMLVELRKRGIRTYIVSAIFRKNSIFFRPLFGRIWRKALRTFRTLFVQDERSKALLAEIGVDNVVIAGDTRFDRVITIADEAERVGVVEQFKGEKRLFVAGSTWRPDEDILLPLINENPDIKFVIAPHEMEESRIERILREVKGGAVRYTQLPSDFAEKQVLVLDTVGLLSRVYGSAEWAYVGGGFGAGIHNTLEAAVYGLPVAFATKYRKFKEACDLIELGVGCSVANAEELKSWFVELKSDSDYLARLSALAKVYVNQHRGVTEKVVKTIFNS